MMIIGYVAQNEMTFSYRTRHKRKTANSQFIKN